MSINKQAFVVLNRFADAMNEGVKRLREEFVRLGLAYVEDAEPIVIEWAAHRYACPLVDGKGKATGRKVLDKHADTYEAARKAKQRVMEALRGDSVNGKAEGAEAEEVEIPAEVIAAAQKLAALAQQYEGARKLATRALATAFAK